MSTQRLATAELVRLFDTGSLSGLTEWELLEQFLTHRDELAFQVLVSRHGPMVLGICRRMLRNGADAEDAFQATFLVLLKRAASLGPGDAVAGWLHGVAVRVAQQARGTAAKRSRREQLGLAVESLASEPGHEDRELAQILDQEIQRLPAKYRMPIVLCYLEGQTHEEAARQLQWPLGTVKGRLARARSLLESRLTRRGIACATGLAALAASSTLEAAVPQALIAATCHAAARVGSGTLFAHVVSSSVAQLIEGVLSTMFLQKLKLIAAAAVVSGVFLTGVGVVARQQGARPEPVERPGHDDFRAQEGPSEPVERPGHDDFRAQEGPSEPVALIDTRQIAKPAEKPSPSVAVDSRKIHEDLIQEARRAYRAARDEHRRGPGSLDRVHSSSLMLMEAERDAAASPTARFDAVEGHFQRMKELARDEMEVGPGNAHVAEAHAYALKAELEVAKANAWQPGPKRELEVAHDGKSEGPGKDPKSRAILAKLEQPISMSFANDTPLEDLLKYIKQATTGPNSAAIPIYVDPLGLQEAEKTLTSPISIDLEGIPLRRTLQLALHPLGLAYFVDDGILVITSQESADQGPVPSQAGPTPFILKQGKLENGEMTMEEMKQFSAELKMKSELMKQIRELKEINDPNYGHPAGSDQVTPLLKEIKELVNELKAEREKGKQGRSQ